MNKIIRAILSNKKQKIRIMSLFLLVVMFTTIGLSCSKQGETGALTPVKLVFWTVHDTREAYNEIINDYRALHPNVSIEFKQLKPEEYKDELIKSFALDQGPDIFSLHNTWVNEYLNLLEPMPASVNLPFKIVTGTVKQEERIVIQQQKMYTPKQIETMFGDTVSRDVVWRYNDGTENDPKWNYRVFGLPLSLDTLALYYNKDILNNAKIPLPAQYWTELESQIEKIRRVDNNNNILLAGIPLGTSTNIERSFDILSLLMMQLKAEMVDEAGNVNFHRIPRELAGQPEITKAPAINALEFYASFADPILKSYTWNNKMDNSLKAFIDGKSAYFLGYAYHRPIIVSQAPKLNFDIAPMLQVQGYEELNYANYWVHSVSNKSKNKNYAWDFIRFMTEQKQAEKYLEKTQKPTALRSLYDKQLENDAVAVFVEQTLTAKSWYRGKNQPATEKIFQEMIDSLQTGEFTSRQVIDLAVQKVQQTMK